MSVVAFTLAKLAGARSSDTANHIWRIQHYLKCLAQRLQGHPRFAPVLTESYINLLFFAAPLHNLGTIGIPDWILLKPSRLSPAELAVMKTHTTLARDVLEQVEKTYGYKGEPFKTLKEMAHSHHERWDGGGYPQGLIEEQIPLAARLLAIADVYEGLISNRVYKVGVPHDQAVAIIFEGRGSHFDPDIVDAFIEIQDEFRAIALRYADTDQDGERILVHVSNFRPVKRVPDVIRIFAEVKKEVPAKLLMIGDGPDRQMVEEMARNLGIYNDVRFLGKQEQISEILSIADLFLLPSETESFGLSALEAMACSVPVISTNAGGLSEINVHGKTGYLADVGDVAAMAGYAISILQNDEELLHFKKAAIAHARKFEKQHIIPKYELLYEKVIADYKLTRESKRLC